MVCILHFLYIMQILKIQTAHIATQKIKDWTNRGLFSELKIVLPVNKNQKLYLNMNKEKKLVIIGITCGMAALGGIFIFASQGYVRQFNIFWPEEVRQTLEFRSENGRTVVVGTVGNAGTNPELIMRAGDYSYIITIINKDKKSHQFYVDGVNLKTKLLEPGQSDKIIIKSKDQATFNYYDVAEQKELLGTIRAVRVSLFE